MTTAPQGTVGRRVDSSTVPHDKGNLYGIMVMQLSILFFVTNDMLTKLVGSDVATGQMVVIRGLFAVLFITLVLAWSGQFRFYRHGFNKTVLLRSCLEAIAAIFFLTALPHLPLANISAIILTIPLTTTAAAAVFLGEQVGIRRWSAVFVGFIGVLAIVRPGLEGFNFYSLFVLGAVVFASARDLITRRIPKGSSLWVITFATMSVSTIGGALLGATEDWLPVTNINYVYLAGAALFMTLAQYFIVIAMNNGEVSVVSSFRYIAMPFSLAYGFLIWSEVPDTLTWLGISLILGSGIYTIFRERKVARLRRAAALEDSSP